MPETKTGLEGVIKYVSGQTGTAAAQNGSTLGYATGFDYEWSDSPLHVYNGSAYAHSKKQRGKGKATIKKLFVDDTVWADFKGGTTATESYKRHYMELQVDGIAGTAADVYSFEDVVCEGLSRSDPEEEQATEEVTLFFTKAPRRLAPASKLIN